MRLPFFRTTLVSCSFLVFLNAIPSPAQQRSEPQLVRVTYAQGEVKFSPGTNGEPTLGDDWMQAETGLPIEAGYTLATENGRAAVEFENGSMVYLAEHSVLQFKKLQIKGDATTTKLHLLTGTATIAHVSGGKDEMVLVTPANTLQSKKDMALRVDSLLDGTVVRAVDTPVMDKETNTRLNPGEAATYTSRVSLTPHPEDDWDRWVAAQRVEREAEISVGLEESGLTEAIPGLADLVKSGHFFDCAPYGKCWEPNQQGGEAQGAEAQHAAAHQLPAGAGSAQTQRAQRQPIVLNRTLLTRCPMETWRYTVLRPDLPNNPQETYTEESFPWIGCFAGSWYFRGRRPVYVLGHRHHHPPRCWTVHTAHGLGFVPRSPVDRKGQPPVNAKNGIFVLAVEKNGLHGRFEPAPANTLHWQTSVPKSFSQDRSLMASVSRVTAPVIQGRLMSAFNGSIGKTLEASAQPGSAIRYDYKSKNFVASRSSMFGGNAGKFSGGGSTVVAHVGSHGVSGGATGHGGGGGGGGWSGGHSGGGSSGGGASSSGSGGGGGHAGGGAGGGGGGGHH